MITRSLASSLSSSKKSAMILGPRQAGKSTLIRSLKPDLTVQLADEEEFFTFSSRPTELRERIETSKPRTVFIDEIQRLPSLLNTVQALIDDAPKGQLKFYLTGSSARKLKRGGANLLPGRVLNFQLGPLCASELGYRADTSQLLAFGALPEIYLEKNTKDRKPVQHLLSSYVSGYIREEIKAEALVRNLEAFTRFTPAAIALAGQFVDYSKLARQAKVSRHSLSRFYEIFEDTLIGQRLWPFEGSPEPVDLIKHPKFYLFDNGVYNAMLGNFNASTDRIGILAEQLVYTQLLHSSWAATQEIKISTFRTRGGLEVDFVVELEGDLFAIEVKGAQRAEDGDASSVRQFMKAHPRCKAGFVLHLGKERRKFTRVWALPWQEGLKELGL